MNEEVFRPIFVPEEFREAVCGRAWLRAMLDAEAALAKAEARAGLIPHEAGATIASCYLDSAVEYIDRALALNREEVRT